MRTEPSGDAATPGRTAGPRAFLDLHCHTRASFDSLADPAAVVRAAAARGLTHLAITDHERIDGALEARAAAEALRAGGAPAPVILVGEEIRTRDGDLIGLFLTEPVPPGLSGAETIAAVRAQGGLVGIPHPFDRFRGSMSKALATLEALAAEVDWIEAWNARLLVGDGNRRAAELAVRVGVPGVAASDAHTVLEVAVASTAVHGDPSTPAGLLAALAGERELLLGRASIFVRFVTPIAKVVQARRGRGRMPAARGAAR